MLFETWLVRNGIVSADLLVNAMEYQASKRPRFGELALVSRKLSMKQVFHILEEQVNSVESFGQIAVRLKYLTKRQVTALLQKQLAQTPSLVQCLLETRALSTEQFEHSLREFRISAYAEFGDTWQFAFCPVSFAHS